MVVLLLCNVLYQAQQNCSLAVYTKALAVDTILFSVILSNLVAVLMLLFPLAGYIADTWLGRYRVITISLVVRLVGSVTAGAGYIAYAFQDFEGWGRVFIYLGMGMTAVGSAGYNANIIPFIIDQMVGASAEELSSAIQWYFLAEKMVDCVAVSMEYFMYLPYFERIALPLLGISCLTIGLFAYYCCRKWIDTTPQIEKSSKTRNEGTELCLETEAFQPKAAKCFYLLL